MRFQRVDNETVRMFIFQIVRARNVRICVRSGATLGNDHVVKSPWKPKWKQSRRRHERENGG